MPVPTSPLDDLSPTARRVLTAACLVLMVLFAAGAVWSVVTWVRLGPGAAVYFPSRAGSSVQALSATLLYGLLTASTVVGARALRRSDPRRR